MPSPSTSARRHPYPPCLEHLETREVPAGLQPTPFDEAFLERINDIRAHPAAFGLHVSLTPPLAFDLRVQRVVRQTVPPQSLAYSVNQAEFSLLPAAGFAIAPGASIYSRTAPVRVFPGFPLFPSLSPPDPLDLMVQAAVQRDPHGYIPLLGVLPRRLHRVIGLVIEDATTACHPDRPCPRFPISPPALDLVYLTTAPAGQSPILTGAVFRDSNGNGKYDVGEGLGGVTIQVGRKTVGRSFAAGDYSVPLHQTGTVRVTFSGGSLPAPITRTVHLDQGTNTRLDLPIA